MNIIPKPDWPSNTWWRTPELEPALGCYVYRLPNGSLMLWPYRIESAIDTTVGALVS